MEILTKSLFPVFAYNDNDKLIICKVLIYQANKNIDLIE